MKNETRTSLGYLFFLVVFVSLMTFVMVRYPARSSKHASTTEGLTIVQIESPVGQVVNSGKLLTIVSESAVPTQIHGYWLVLVSWSGNETRPVLVRYGRDNDPPMDAYVAGQKLKVEKILLGTDLVGDCSVYLGKPAR